MLTGLPNRLSLFDRLTAVAERSAGGEREGVALILIDLDSFKDINDRVGARIGDLLLRAACRRIEGAVAAIDTLARCGSDSFAALLHPATREEMAPASAAIAEAFATPFQFGDLAIECSASIGMAWAGHREGVSTLFRDAEWAMYEARRLGGARIVQFSPDAGDPSL